MDEIETLQSKSLGAVDYVLFALLLVVSLGIGIYSALQGRGNSTTLDFLLGGREMSPVPVAISLLGGLISAISILGLATEMYFYGTQLCINLIGCFLGIFIVQFITLPVLYPLKIISLNEYLIMRYHSIVLRKLAVSAKILVSFFYMGMCLYAPSLTLATVTSLSTWASIAIMGSICTFYITIGGVKAVVYTDVIQTILMFGGVLVVVIVCCLNVGGLGTVFELANEGGRIQFFNMDPNPFVRHTFWSVLTQGAYSMIGWIGLNQSTYQRFASVSTLAMSRRLCVFFMFGLYALWITFYVSGVVAYATYKDCDPLTSGRIEKPDQIIPYLVLDKLSHLTGMAGLFVAAVYGGVLSSLSTTGNSLACIIWEDLLKDLPMLKGISDQKSTFIIKVLSAVSGLVGIGIGMLAGQLGNLFHISVSISNTFTGPYCGIFVCGICAPWVNYKGAFTGFVTGVLFNLWLVIGKFVVGGGSPKKLPLSTAGCPENLLPVLLANSTMNAFANSSFDGQVPGVSFNEVTGDDALSGFFNDTLAAASPTPYLSEEEEEIAKTIYSLSYCYTGVLGLLITVVVGTVVSIATGPIKPYEIEARLISPPFLRLYKFLWRKLKPHEAHKVASEEDEINDKKAAVPMISVNGDRKVSAASPE
ncbi:sodium-coupled monocarboxylate transporter 1-like [Macrobrachium rosenbergii]|uniref:sodium-coupled monocarboxylate transporter 1-like n=1 Tax=Macrobrachium rosenbergii TaxID=79674 RepID=UPI0034D7566C